MFLESDKKLREHLTQYEKGEMEAFPNEIVPNENESNDIDQPPEDLNDLVDEIESSTPNWRWKCGKCPKAFNRRIELQLHRHTHRDDAQNAPFDNCDAFDDDQVVKVKIEPLVEMFSPEWTDDGTFNDDSRTNLVYNSMDNSSYSIDNSATDESRWVCNVCAKRFSRRAHLRAHKQIHALEKLETKRDVNVFSANNVARKLKVKTIVPNVLNGISQKVNKVKKEVNNEMNRWKCKRCFGLFRTRRLLRDHNLTHRGDSMVPLTVKIESSPFVENGTFNDIPTDTFVNEPSKIQPNHSANNHKSAPKKSNLQHQSDKRKVWKCGKCRKIFESRQSLRAHKMTHTFEIKLNLKTKTKNLMVKLKNSNENLFKKKQNKNHSSHPPKIVSSTPTIIKPNRTSSFIERDWPCSTCHEVFKRRNILREHRRTLHPNVKNVSVLNIKQENQEDFVAEDYILPDPTSH